ncbi:hypothetical protein PPERSA_09014 [Pseudocohnilembus persalinus]|uniref:protein-tyrosine-phosphatase n=1 Tax=Pseudocohnilembus persalinus TaxID=266149 RepID=A0A0V0R321_PSEPJ|nr:hypothetical protein PPERSA_09014 [Pseudocohnilembus persalinus]|eukprot:KRX08910.1 hypothetical protein PPERSA_09014 [Pseudocohnilembus persalinus]
MDFILDEFAHEIKYNNQQPANHIYCFNKNNTNGNLYLGNRKAAETYDFLLQNNVKYVLSLTNSSLAPNYESFKDIINDHIIITIEDTEDQNITEHLKQCHNFIDNALKNANVLVHCQAGVSRSASIVITYLMNRLEIDLTQAYGIVRKKRPIIGPNNGFMNQMKQIETNKKRFPQEIDF